MRLAQRHSSRDPLLLMPEGARAATVVVRRAGTHRAQPLGVGAQGVGAAVARRIVGQAVAFNEAKERVAMWRRKAREEGWCPNETVRLFRIWGRRQRVAKAKAAAHAQQVAKPTPPTTPNAEPTGSAVIVPTGAYYRGLAGGCALPFTRRREVVQRAACLVVADSDEVHVVADASLEHGAMTRVLAQPSSKTIKAQLRKEKKRQKKEVKQMRKREYRERKKIAKLMR